MNRINYLDIAKGFGIFLVYIGHCYIGERTQTLSNVIYWIYSFHMPLFFFVSGILFSSKKKKFHIFIWNKSVSLLIPYALFSILNWPLLTIFVGSPGNVVLHGWGQNPLWFIPILYLLEVLHYFIIFDKRWKRWGSILILFVILIWKTQNNGWLPYAVSELAWFYFCLLSGYLLKSLIIIPNNPTNAFIISISLFIAHFFILFFIIRPYNINYRLQDNDLLSYIARYFIGMLGTFALLYFSISLNKWTQLTSGLRWLGQNTIVILCTHKMYYEILQTVNYHKNPLGGVNFILTWGMIILTILLYNHFIKPIIDNLRIRSSFV